MTPSFNPLPHLFYARARLDLQPFLGPSRNIKTLGALRYHPLELLDLKSSKQIKASVDNVISESNFSSQALRQFRLR
jgi:hypothetical protein